MAVQHQDTTLDELFDSIVVLALARLPEVFRLNLDNVEVVTQDWPTSTQLMKAKVPRGATLYGLYQGVPQIRRTNQIQLPDKITLFRMPILQGISTRQQLASRIEAVLRHEIGHHFGMDEIQLKRIGY